MLILPYNDIVADGTFHAPCPGSWNFHLDEGQEWMVRGKGGGLCQISSFAHSYLLLTLLHPAFCPRNVTCVDYKSLVLWLPGSSGHGETLSLGKIRGRKEEEEDGVFISSILSLQSYFGQAMSTKQRSLVLSRWPSAYNSLLPGFVNISSL